MMRQQYSKQNLCFAKNCYKYFAMLFSFLSNLIFINADFYLNFIGSKDFKISFIYFNFNNCFGNFWLIIIMHFIIIKY